MDCRSQNKKNLIESKHVGDILLKNRNTAILFWIPKSWHSFVSHVTAKYIMHFYLIQTDLFLIPTKLYYGKENKP